MVAVSAEGNEATVLVSRTGRDLQRYSKHGRRKVVGCIPYRYRHIDAGNYTAEEEKEVEVLVISSQNGKGVLFPKGGWETDETIKQAASRETLEEAGVTGIVEHLLGTWKYKSKSSDTYHKGYMFPLLVKKQLDLWPERHVRQRTWMSVKDARNACQQQWMKEALDSLEQRLSLQQQQQQQLNLDEKQTDSALCFKLAVEGADTLKNIRC